MKSRWEGVSQKRRRFWNQKAKFRRFWNQKDKFRRFCLSSLSVWNCLFFLALLLFLSVVFLLFWGISVCVCFFSCNFLGPYLAFLAFCFNVSYPTCCRTLYIIECVCASPCGFVVSFEINVYVLHT